MHLSIIVDLDAAAPAAAERRAVFALAPPRGHRAPLFPLGPFLAQLLATRAMMPVGGEQASPYPAAARRPRTSLLNLTT